MDVRRRIALCLIVALMAGCQGSHNCSMCGPAVSHLSGSLSGLVGYRLKLQNGATPLDSTFDGAQANGTNVVFGTANFNTNYDITVQTQPTSPSQTCTVKNGTGNTGSGDVTNIVVTCTTNPPRFLYVANRGSGDVSAYTIDAVSGNLTPVAGSPFATGGSPVAIAVDPTGAYAYVANQSSGTISGFAIDRNSGALTPITGSPFGTPVSPSALAVDPSSSFVYVTANGGSGVIST
jgi:DNA-binding beta-propeller fold protein YncE